MCDLFTFDNSWVELEKFDYLSYESFRNYSPSTTN